MSLHLENLPEENRRNYKRIGFELHSGRYVNSFIFGNERARRNSLSGYGLQ